MCRARVICLYWVYDMLWCGARGALVVVVIHYLYG